MEIGQRHRPRSRSVSLGGRMPVSMQSILRPKASSTAEINNDERKIVNLVAECSVAKYGPRGSKSATCARKSSVSGTFDCQPREKLTRRAILCQKLDTRSIWKTNVLLFFSLRYYIRLTRRLENLTSYDWKLDRRPVVPYTWCTCSLTNRWRNYTNYLTKLWKYPGTRRTKWYWAGKEENVWFSIFLFNVFTLLVSVLRLIITDIHRRGWNVWTYL